MPRSLRVVCLLARDAGRVCLESLLMDDRSKLLAVATHRFLPVSESPQRREREEFAVLRDIAAKHRIPFITVDSKQEAALDALKPYSPWDVLVSCSWRFHVPPAILSQARIANINLHRGKLPDYRGAEPVKRALLNGDKAITVTAHVMVDEIDAGPVLAESSQAISIKAGEALDVSVSRIKKEILPLYPQVLAAALERRGGPKIV